MARTRSPNAATSSMPAQPHPNGALGTAELGSESMNAARALLDIPGTYTRDVLRLTEESMRHGERTLEKMLGSLRTALNDAQAARDLQELLAIEVRLAGEQVANCMQGSSLEFNRWFGAAAKAFQGMPLTAQAFAQRFGLPTSDPADAEIDSPLAMFERTRAAWSQYMQQWASTVRNGVIPA